MIHTLKVTLKQHTPLIHFQHDQDGATLRASEVKPKLDRYILTQLGKQECETLPDDDFEKVLDAYEKSHPGFVYNDEDVSFAPILYYEIGKYVAKQNGWLVGKGEHPSLDYKVKFQANNRVPAITLQSQARMNNRGETKYYSFWRDPSDNHDKDFPLLLSNMGGKDREEQLFNFSYYQSVTALFFVSAPELLGWIQNCVSDFFANQNFGQRSDKGFGSFSVTQINDNNCPFPDMPNICYLELNEQSTQTVDFQAKIFNTIDFYWKCLKSGVNYTNNGQRSNRYIKAFVWTYLNSRNNTWEKRIVKTTFGLITGREVQENNNPASFARAILGCPDKFEYRNMHRTVAIRHSADPMDPDFIARIPSPVVFKPIVNGNVTRIYIIPNEELLYCLRQQENLQFVFTCDTATLPMTVNPSVFSSIRHLLSCYHQHIANANFGRMAFERNGEYERFLQQQEEFFSRHNFENNHCWFFPLDFGWRKLTSRPVLIKRG